MAILINLTIFFLAAAQEAAFACPACLTSDNNGGTTQKLLMLAFMGFFPLLAAAGIGFLIYKMTKNSG